MDPEDGSEPMVELNRHWYELFMPVPNERYNGRLFREGLRCASDEEWDIVQKICKKRCLESQLAKVTSYEYRTKQDLVDLIVEKTVDMIKDDLIPIFHYVPKDWLSASIEAYVNHEAEESYEKPAIARRQLDREPKDNGRSPIEVEDIDGDWPVPVEGVIPLYQMIFVLEVIGVEVDKPNLHVKIPASRCVGFRRFGGHPHEMVRDLFLDQFQLITGDMGEQYDLRNGRLLWSEDGLPRPICSQRDFEIAITNMYHTRGDSWHLKFTFFPEPSSPTADTAVSESVSSNAGKGKGRENPSDGRGRPTSTTQRVATDASKLAQQRVSMTRRKEKEKAKAEFRTEQKPVVGETSRQNRTPYKTSNPEFQKMIREIQYRSSPIRMPTDLAAQEALIKTSYNVHRALDYIKTVGLREDQIQRIPETIRRKPVPESSGAPPLRAFPGSAKEPAKLQDQGAPPRQDLSTGYPSVVPSSSAAGNRVSKALPILPADKRQRRTSFLRRFKGKGKAVSSAIEPGGLSQSGHRDSSEYSRESSNKRVPLFMAPLRKIMTNTSKNKSEEHSLASSPTTPGERYNEAFEEISRSAFKSGKDVEDLHRKLTAKTRSSETGIEDYEPEPPKDATAQFRDLLNMGALTQMEDSIEKVEINGRKADWDSCCRMFQVDSYKTSLDDRVPVAGLHQPLFQYQAFAVFWQMIMSRNAGGGIVADSPGLGKTLTFLAMLVVERQLSILWQDVEVNRQIGSRKHLPKEGQNIDDVCPSQGRPNRHGWILCPCVESGPTSRMEPNHGVRLALVPPALITNWRLQWQQHINLAVIELDMRLLVTSQDSQGFGHFQLADRAENINALKATEVGRGPDSARPGQERFLVLTTAQSYDSWADKFKRGGPGTTVEALETSVINGDNFRWKKGQYKYRIQFGIACADESHEEVRGTQGRVDILARLPGNPWCWGYSGTPFSHSPRSLQGILSAIEKQCVRPDITSTVTRWSRHALYKQFTKQIFDKLCADFVEYAKNKRQNQDMLDTLLQRLQSFLTTFMIRRTPDTQWFGHDLVGLGPSIHQEINLTHNRQWDEAIAALEPGIQDYMADRLRLLQRDWNRVPPQERTTPEPTSLGFRNTVNTRYLLRILATCPSLVKFIDQRNEFSLKNEEIKQWRGNSEKRSPYAKNIKEIFEHSPKLLWLRKFLIDLDETRDVNGDEQKVIILTSFNCIGLVTKLMIERFIPGKQGRVGLMYAGMTNQAKMAMIEAFVGITKVGDQPRPQKENYQYLIGTTTQLGKGHQLTRASVVVLMEPQLDFKDEFQAFCRVRRIGQKNPVTYTYKLLDHGSKIEKQIQQNQEEQGAIHGVEYTQPGSALGPLPHRLNITMVSPTPALPSIPPVYDRQGSGGAESSQFGASGHREPVRDTAPREIDPPTPDAAGLPPPPGSTFRSQKPTTQLRSYKEHEEYRALIQQAVPVEIKDVGPAWSHRKTLREPGTEPALRRMPPSSSTSLHSDQSGSYSLEDPEY